MSKMPWVRFFASDWLGGTRGMSAVETGVYITLIATMYERGEPIAEDHSRLSRLCGASNATFKKALETLVKEGKILRLEAGLWNSRVEKERVYLSEKSEVGSRAAKARWTKNDKENNATNDASALPAQSQGNANQKPYTRNQKSFSGDRGSSRAREAQEVIRRAVMKAPEVPSESSDTQEARADALSAREQYILEEQERCERTWQR